MSQNLLHSLLPLSLLLTITTTLTNHNISLSVDPTTVHIVEHCAGPAVISALTDDCAKRHLAPYLIINSSFSHSDSGDLYQ